MRGRQVPSEESPEEAVTYKVTETVRTTGTQNRAHPGGEQAREATALCGGRDWRLRALFEEEE